MLSSRRRARRGRRAASRSARRPDSASEPARPPGGPGRTGPATPCVGLQLERVGLVHLPPQLLVALEAGGEARLGEAVRHGGQGCATPAAEERVPQADPADAVATAKKSSGWKRSATSNTVDDPQSSE